MSINEKFDLFCHHDEYDVICLRVFDNNGEDDDDDADADDDDDDKSDNWKGRPFIFSIS